MSTVRSRSGRSGVRAKVASGLRHFRRKELVGFSRSLSADQVLSGYVVGRVPWPRPSLPFVPWFAPNPRAIVLPAKVHLGKNVRRIARRTEWTTTVNAAFESVVDCCADRVTTWIGPELREIYCELHRRSHAYSVEVWDESQDLIGGLYGIQAGGVFGVDSQFHRVDHASKVAFAELARRLGLAGNFVIDCQFPTPHLFSLGAEAIPARAFSTLLVSLRDVSVSLDTAREPVAKLVDSRAGDAG